jgi:endoglucanase
VWLTGGTPAQVAEQVRTTLVEAALERAEPVFVVYDIPGRDCSEYSAGGAADQAAYQSWRWRAAVGLHRLHPTGLADRRGLPGAVRPAMG